MKKLLNVILSLTILGLYFSCEQIEETKTPNACFTPSKTTAHVDELISFDNCSTDATSYLWDFGDDATSAEISPTHFYEEAGQFVVKLRATNGSKIDETTVVIDIEDIDPVACFTISPSTAEVNTAVTFTNCSENATSYQWDFNSDGTIDSELENPVIEFYIAGTYTIKLIAISDAGTDNVTHQMTITNSTSNLLACFTVSPNPAGLNESVTFTNCSTGATSYEWDFNNDGTSDSDYENPIVTFTQAGTYTVKLTAHSSTSSHSVTHQLVINAGVIDPKVYTLPVSWVEHYTNEFNASGDWTEETTSDYSAAISGGLYTITNYTTENSWFFWTNAVTMPATTDDYDLEIYYKVNYDNVTQGSGLFWGLNSSTFEYYYYRFTPYNGSGYFTIGDKDIAAWSEGHFWEGGNITDYNKITARKYGNSMYFFMNGVYYTTLPFEGNYGNYFGFLIGADAKISIEWIGLWILDEGSKAGKLSKEFTPNMYHGTAGKLFQKVETTLK